LSGPFAEVGKQRIIRRFRDVDTFASAQDAAHQGIHRSYRHVDEPFDLPAPDFPRLHLVAMATDRQVYRPGDQVHIFVAAPDAAG
jgi:hypothetical protein